MPSIINAFKEYRSGTQPDPRTSFDLQFPPGHRLTTIVCIDYQKMLVYREVPMWWYGATILVSFAMAMATCVRFLSFRFRQFHSFKTYPSSFPVHRSLATAMVGANCRLAFGIPHLPLRRHRLRCYRIQHRRPAIGSNAWCRHCSRKLASQSLFHPLWLQCENFLLLVVDSLADNLKINRLSSKLVD